MKFNLLRYSVLVSVVVSTALAGVRHTEYFPFLSSSLSIAPKDTLPDNKKTRRPTYKPQDRYGNPYTEKESRSPLLLKDPDNVTQEVVLDTNLQQYTIQEKVGENDYRPPTEMTFEEYYNYRNRESLKNYWRSKQPVSDSSQDAEQGPFALKIPVRGLEGPFGSNTVDIRPSGLVTLDFGGKWQRVYNPAIPVAQQQNGIFDFDQQISMNVIGRIGEKLQITANWDTKAAFQFQNNIKVQYTAFEEDIIQGVEIGRVSMPLNSSLINGAQNLFGVKTKLQFGRMTVTGIVARQDGKVDELVIQGGTQGRSFEIRGDNYEENRHFLISQFHRDIYEPSLQSLPFVNSQVRITRLEVYVTNRNNTTNNLRDMVAYLDLGEAADNLNNPTLARAGIANNAPADNDNNALYDAVSVYRDPNTVRDNLIAEGLVQGSDFEIIKSARRLTDREYTFQPELGYVTLQAPIRPDEVLAVAYEYSYQGKTYKVGELQDDYSTLGERDVIVLKLLKPSTIKTRLPTWDLMMKNIYSLGTNQLSRDQFQFRVIYRDDLSGADLPNLQEGVNTANVPLLQVLNLDRLNPNGDPAPDGNFDYVDGVTVDSRYGRIIFPVLEPFGSDLAEKFDPSEGDLVKKYAFTQLYDSTKGDALNFPSVNKYYFKGRYQAASSNDIILPGINIAPGSVTVLVGSSQLVEGSDYTVDYSLGRLKIINEGALRSGQEIRIRFEKQDLFNFRRKSFYGARFDYKVNKNVLIGANVFQQNEAPQITRVNVGDEPSRNTVLGLDGSFETESRVLTKMVDKIPLIETKVPSQINFQGEVASLLPGHNKQIDKDTKGGIAYIDDFEGSRTPFDLTRTPFNWKLASTPRRFAEQSSSGLNYNYNRSLLAWYNIDNIFYRSGNNLPNYLQPDLLTNHFERNVQPQELFPNQQQFQVNLNLVTLDLAYYPDERGPYNYTPNLNSDGTLTNPSASWAGIQREIRNDIDFDNANMQYIEFWLLSPYIDSTNDNTIIDGKPFDLSNNGKLYLNLGSVSEDIIKDGRHGFENGLPTSPNAAGSSVDTTIWGVVTTQQFITEAFDANPDSRPAQDVGMDGVNLAGELEIFESFVNSINLLPLSQAEKDRILADPSNDDFKYFLGDDADQAELTVLQRYKGFNGTENNSPIAGSSTFNPSNYTTPDNEDLNNDNTISDLEEYYEYEININRNQMEVGQNYIVAKTSQTVNGDNVTWYQFRIPIRDANAIKVGDINGFKSIRFMRMYVTEFESPVVLRMANFQLVSNQWRVYLPNNLDDPGLVQDTEPDDAILDVSTASVEENGQGDPNTSPYVVPPDFERDFDVTSTVQRLQNEQSLRLCIDDLDPGSARAVFKNVSYDFINYGKVDMFIHAESITEIPDGEVKAFVRFGTDFVDNYYEVEIPLVFTNPKNTFDPALIWPEANELSVVIQDLVETKLERDRAQAPNTIPYSREVNGKIYRVVGRPDLSTVVTIMIGLRNPQSNAFNRSFCVWVNEFRLSEFNHDPSIAAAGKVNVRMADFANVQGSYRFIGAGFGPLEQKISERQRNNTFEWGLSANVTLDKFLPAKWGVKLPLYVGYNKRDIAPQYDPLNPDVKLNQSIENLPEESQSDYKALVIDRTKSRAINLTNVQKMKMGGGKAHLWDVSNLRLSLGFTDTRRTSYDIFNYDFKHYNAGLGYVFNNPVKPIEPFKNIKALDSKWLGLFQEFNLGLLPSSLTFNTELNRRITTTQYYESGPLTNLQTPLYEKAFTLDRSYGLLWNFTRNLSGDYAANARAVIDEPLGAPGSSAYKDSVLENLTRFGRLKIYDQSAGLNYKVPLDKIPLVDWTNLDASYKSKYTWTANALGVQDTMGNLVGNNRDIGLDTRFDFERLYNKSKYLKKVNNPVPPKRVNPADLKKDKGADTTAKKKEPAEISPGLRSALRILMMVRSLNVKYTIGDNTLMPGYLPTPKYIGLSPGDNATDWLPFTLGSQNPDIRQTAADNGWMSRSRFLNQSYTQNSTRDLTAQLNIEPLKDFRVTVNGKLQNGSIYQEIWRIDSTGDVYTSDNPQRSGNHTVSFISIQTAFKDQTLNDGDPYSSSLFEEFKNNREIIRQRLGADYDQNSQDVLIPAFLAAYTGKNAATIKLNAFQKAPLPNWRVDFSGLTRIKGVKKMFDAVTLSHGYTSQYAIGAFASSLIYGPQFVQPGQGYLDPIQGDSINSNGQIVPVYIINEVSIREAFSPLIGINVRTKSKISIRAEYRRTRNLSLSLNNSQTREERNYDYVIGLGYAKTKFPVPKIFTGGRKVVLPNELNFRVDFTLRDNLILQRKFTEQTTVTAGNFNWQLKPTVTYNINRRVSVLFYFERTFNNPRISSSFKRTTTSIGTQIRFTLQ